MQLEILTFCDAATDYGGRLNILGATDHLITPVLPLKYPHCAVVARMRAARIEEGSHVMRLMIIDADGQPLLNVDGKMEIRFQQGMGGAVNLIINAQNLEFKEAGEYAIEVAVDGIQLGSSALFIHQREPNQSHADTIPPSPRGRSSAADVEAREDPDNGSGNGSDNGGGNGGGASNGGRRII